MKTVNDILGLNPLITYWMIMNYRKSTKIGEIINGTLYFDENEYEEIIGIIYKDSREKRKFIYKYIKEHPAIEAEELYKHLIRYTNEYPYTKENVDGFLCDISQPETYLTKFPGLYEDDRNRLFVEGYEINTNKKYDKNHGLFCDIIKRRMN